MDVSVYAALVSPHATVPAPDWMHEHHTRAAWPSAPAPE
jgi:hypothetical protein